jgi:superfamily II DNA or RNA helicase
MSQMPAEVDMKSLDEIERLLLEKKDELNKLDARRAELISEISEIKSAKNACLETEGNILQPTSLASVTSQSPQESKIDLFRSLFRGREDVYPRRFENPKSGKKGYAPVCHNEWVNGICEKPRIRCEDCIHRQFLPVTNDVIRNHLLGIDPQKTTWRDFTAGVYPMMLDETCWFLAVDFDKASWREDAQAFLETCKLFDVPAALERSRSGNGGHIWIFFTEPVPVMLARKMGAFLLTQTMERRPEIGLDSYDRFFPSQDTLPKGGFGNLIALPLQKKPRDSGNSVFVDEDFIPYQDQWAFLSSVQRMYCNQVEIIVGNAEKQGELTGVRIPVTDENDDRPWVSPPSRKQKEMPILGPLPESIELVLSNQIYVPKSDLTPSLRNRLIRLAAFQNPEFYQAQAMRLSTYGKPRIISCSEDFPKHLALPRGCLDELLDLFQSLKVEVKLADERHYGTPLDLQFHGELHSEQQQAADTLLEYETGVLAASTAFGKTVVAAYIIAQRKVNTLVVVHRRGLLDQWVNMLSQFLKMAPKDIGQIGGGKRKPTGELDVAMVQSLNQKTVVDDLVGQYGHVIVDECHHISAVSFEQVIRQCKARYIAGLSATVTRKDGHHPIIFMQCGPIRYKVDDRKQAESRAFNHKVIVRPTNFQLPPYLRSGQTQSIQEIYTLLVNDEERNRMIIDDVVGAVMAKRNPVLLTERREHLDILVNLLAGRIQNVFVLAGGMGKKQRKYLMDQVAAVPVDEPRVIIATGRYLGEGFDDARLDTLFLALPISWRGTLIQYAGRLHRTNAAKREVVIYDYSDFEVPVLAKMHARRRSGYKTMGYRIGVQDERMEAVQLQMTDL